MHQFTHAWLAFMAIKRLEKNKDWTSEEDWKYAQNLIDWFQKNKDCVIQGAWYPDTIIKDNGTSHILKITPFSELAKAKGKMKEIPSTGFKSLPEIYLCFSRWGKNSPLRQESFLIDQGTNLPDRCESFTQTVIDHLKIQYYEEKGSPVAPTSNQVAHLLFMQSHYVADAHVPLHCDSRQFSEGKDFHADLEEIWEKQVINNYKLDTSDKNNPRFIYDEEGYPSKNVEKFKESYLERVQEELINRPLGSISSCFKSENNNVWEFISAVCQNSYLLSYHFFKPEEVGDPEQADFTKWKDSHEDDLLELSFAVLADAADSIARVWLRSWRRFKIWEVEREKEKEEKEEKEEEMRKKKEEEVKKIIEANKKLTETQ